MNEIIPSASTWTDLGPSCRKKWEPTPVFLPGKSHGQSSLVGYHPWGCRARHNLLTKQEVIILSEISQTPYDIANMWSLKYDTHELIYGTDSQTQRRDLWLPRRRGSGGQVDWEFGTGRCKLVFVRWRNNKAQL